MPVIRGKSTANVLPPDRRRGLLELLARELAGAATPGGPLIFEIPLEQSNRMDVLVVWEAWEGISSEERTGLILEAYAGRQENIAQALGVTYPEAVEQQLLPYAVVPMVRPGEADPAEVRAAMLAEGGIALPGDKVDLRFPNMAMAKAAHRRLCDKLPRGYWSVAESVASMT